jgi:hypothetical protein
MNINNIRQPADLPGTNWTTKESQSFKDLFGEIKKKFIELEFVDKNGDPNKKLFKIPLPALNQGEKEAVKSLLKEKIIRRDPASGISFKTTAEEIEKKIDEEIGLSSFVLCGSRLIQVLGVPYFVRALEEAFKHLHGVSIDMEKELGPKIIRFLDRILHLASDTDFRNYFTHSYVSLFGVQECVVAHLSNQNAESNFQGPPLPDRIRRNAFDKLFTQPEGFGVMSLEKYEFINVKSLGRQNGILTSGSLSMEILNLLHNQPGDEMRPMSGITNGWSALFHIAQGLIKPSCSGNIESTDILKAWRRAARGADFADRKEMCLMIEKFLDEFKTAKSIAEKLNNDAKNHLKNRKEGGGALIFHALKSFYEGNYLTEEQLREIAKLTEDVWKDSVLSKYFSFMCQNSEPLPFSSVYASICLEMMDPSENSSKIKVRLGGEWDSIISLDVQTGLCGINVGHLRNLFSSERCEIELAEKLLKRNANQHAAVIFKLLEESKRNAKSVESFIDSMNNCKMFSSSLFKILIKLIKAGDYSQACELLKTAQSKDAWSGCSNNKAFLDCVWHIANHFIENDHFDEGFHLFSTFIVPADITGKIKVKGLFKFLTPFKNRSGKIPCFEHTLNVLKNLTSEQNCGLVEKCLSLCLHCYQSGQRTESLELWQFGKDNGLWKELAANCEYLKLAAYLIKENYPAHQCLPQLIEEFQPAYRIAAKSDELQSLIKDVQNLQHSLFEKKISNKQIDEALAMLKKVTINDPFKWIASLEELVLETQDDSPFLDPRVERLYQTSGKSPLNPALELARKTGKFNQTLAHALQTGQSLDEHQEKEVISLIVKNEFQIGYECRRHMPDKLIILYYKCIESLTRKEILKGETFFEHLFGSKHFNKYKSVPRLLIRLSEGNLPKDADKALHWLDIYLQNCKGTNRQADKAIINIIRRLLKSQDDRINNITEKLLQKLRDNKTPPASCYRWFLHELRSSEIRLKDSELLSLIKIARITRETGDAVWTYLAKLATLQQDSKIKQACWRAFIDVIKPSRDRFPFESGEPLLYLSFCSAAAEQAEILTMLKHFGKMRAGIDKPSVLIMNGYMALLTKGYEQFTHVMAPEHKAEFAKEVWKGYPAIQDLVEKNEQLPVSADIRLLHFFGLYLIGEEKYFSAGMDLLSSTLSSRGKNSDKWKNLIADALGLVIISPFMKIENNSSEELKRREQIVTDLLEKTDKNDFPYETMAVLLAYYRQLSLSLGSLLDRSQMQRVEILDQLLQRLSKKGGQLGYVLSDISSPIYADLIDTPDAKIFNKLGHTARFQNIHIAFGNETTLFQRFMHRLIDFGIGQHINPAQKGIKNSKMRKWLGENGAKELECHLNLILSMHDPYKCNPSLAIKNYNECLELNCTFELYPEIHSLIQPFLDIGFVSYKNVREFVIFFQHAMNPEKSCYSHFRVNTTDVIEQFLTNDYFREFLIDNSRLDLIQKLSDYFCAYLENINKTSGKTEKIAKSLIENIFSFKHSSGEAHQVSKKIFDLMLSKTEKEHPSRFIRQIHYLIYYVPYCLPSEDIYRESALIYDIVEQLNKNATSSSLIRAFLLLGRHKQMLKKDDADKFQELSEKNYATFNSYRPPLIDAFINVYMKDALAMFDHMLSIAPQKNLLQIFSDQLDFCSELLEIKSRKEMSSIIHSFYARLILKCFNRIEQHAKELFVHHIEIYLKQAVAAQHNHSFTLDYATLLQLVPCLIEAYKLMKVDKTLMEDCLLLIFRGKYDPAFLYSFARMFVENVPESLSIQILATSKVSKNDRDNFESLNNVILGLIHAQTPESFAHAMLLMTLNAECLQSHDCAIRLIKEAISIRFKHLYDPAPFMNYMNHLITAKKEDPKTFKENLLKVYDELSNDNDLEMPPYFNLTRSYVTRPGIGIILT